jgi:hypothetical protein
MPPSAHRESPRPHDPAFAERVRASFRRQPAMAPIGMVADNAAASLAPAGASVLTVEYKINLLAQAARERLVAQGKVVRACRPSPKALLARGSTGRSDRGIVSPSCPTSMSRA